MPLDNFMKKHLQNFRQDQKEEAITIWTLTKADTDPNDMYASQIITSGSRLMSGSVAWTNRAQRHDTSGGFYETGDAEILVSRDEREYFMESVNSTNVYVVIDDVELRISSVKDCQTSNEIIISLNRRR